MKWTATAPSSVPPTDRLRLTREGFAWFGTALLVGVVAWSKSLNILFLLAYLMLAMLVLNVVLARYQVRQVSASRAPIPPVRAGENVWLHARIRNGGRRAVSVGVRDPSGGQAGTWFLDGLASGADVECDRRALFSHRGRVKLAPLVISSGLPFGFVRYERMAPAHDEIVVLPAIGTADPDGMRHWLLRRAGSLGQARKMHRRAIADPADICGIRPYRSGDSLRHVHWRSSARRRELMVREYDTAPSPELLLVVEPWLPSQPTAVERANLEATLSLAATIIQVWCRQLDARVTVVLVGAEPVISAGAPSEVFAREATIPLADVQCVSDVATLAPEVFGRGLRGSARVVASSRANSPLAAAISRSTGQPFVTVDPSTRLPWYQPPSPTSIPKLGNRA